MVYMKKISSLLTTTLFLCSIFLTTAMLQCRKQGTLANSYNRSFLATPDTTIFSPFYNSNVVPGADITPDANDVVKTRSVQDILNEYCATANCHGGTVSPRFAVYADAMKYVNAGNPGLSKLWTLITTNNFNKAMPPVNLNHELTTKDKNIVYNWIKNGAKEYPALADYRPTAIYLIETGCASGNCHNQATVAGVWARSGLLSDINSADTVTFAVTGSSSTYSQLINQSKLNLVWTAYKDSVKTFYADTIANASFRPWKTFGTPTTTQSCRGPLNTYDDIVMDIMYPKGNRTGTTVRYTDPVSGKKFYVRNTYLDGTSAIITRVDSTLQIANPQTGVWSASLQGGMARSDGNLAPSEIAIIKGWYFTDPNIPDVWKYGNNNTGIFRYKKSMNVITKGQ